MWTLKLCKNNDTINRISTKYAQTLSLRMSKRKPRTVSHKYRLLRVIAEVNKRKRETLGNHCKHQQIDSISWDENKKVPSAL